MKSHIMHPGRLRTFLVVLLLPTVVLVIVTSYVLIFVIDFPYKLDLEWNKLMTEMCTSRI